MDRHEVKRLIASVSPELKAAGLSAVYLFGSQARGDAAHDSDIDLAFDVTEESGFNLLDQGRLQMRLQDLLRRKVDFVSRDGMRPRMRARFDAEMVRVF